MKSNVSGVQKSSEKTTADPEPHPELLSQLSVTTKVITIYTGVDQALKKLTKPTDLVLILTPATSDSEQRWDPIVWKVLHFEQLSSMKIQVTWSIASGFCALQEEDDGTLTPGPLQMLAKPGHALIFREIEEGNTTEMYLDSESMIEGSTDEIAIINKTGTPIRVALCTIDPKKHEAARFSPVASTTHFGISEGQSAMQCGPPSLLQVYTANGYKERQPFQNGASKLKPIFTKDLGALHQTSSFRLYSKSSGHLILE
ncbi:hypothetical protein DL96DRAFT_1081963 [Flagelloscypha sp. PMI_526]|nr:hypothetical protein DL96DRAFT_1081963 [Flagelloscypha sp. PMI_526]